MKIRYAPRSSTPQYKSFSEIKRATLAAEVLVLVGFPTSSNESFSSELLVDSSILAGYSESILYYRRRRVERREPSGFGGKRAIRSQRDSRDNLTAVMICTV